MTDTLQSLIDPKAKLGRRVQIGHGARIYGSAHIGDDCQLGDHCIIGHPAGGRWSNQPVVLGSGATIRSHSVIYEGSEFGPKLETGHHVLIREGTIAGPNLRVGSFSDLEGDCTIGDFCRFHSYTHVGRGSRIGHFVWLYSLTTLTNDPLPPSDLVAAVVLEDGVVVCVGATLMPGTILRRGAYVSAQSTVSGEVPAGAVVSGPQGRIVSHVSFVMNLEHGIRHPWMGHFSSHYPEEAQPRLRQLREAILAGRDEFVRRHLHKEGAS